MSPGVRLLRKTGLSGFNGLLVALLVLCAFAAGVVLDKVVLKDRSLWPPMTTPSVGDEVQVHYHTLYTKCKDVVTETDVVSRGSIGDYLAQVAREWQVSLSSGSDSVHQFSRSIDDFCPEHSRFRFVTLAEGAGAVYRGKELSQAGLLVRMYTDIPESRLRKTEKDLLRAGIVLEDEPGLVDAKVAKYLEGIID